jgi:RHS repeat-associated protein
VISTSLAQAVAANKFLYDGQYLDTTSGLYYLRARWYDPTTASFTSVDPLVAITGEPYSYAGNDPVNGSDPLGLWGWNPISDATQAWNDTGRKVVHAVATHTIGLCVNLSAGWGPYGTASGCLAFSGGVPTLVGTAGGGGSSPTGSATLGLLVSNAHKPSDLRGPFAGGGGSFDLGLSLGEEASAGTGSCNQTIWENQVSAGLGLDLPIPFEGHGGVTYTWTWSP